ncbi:MAG: glycosyltransferase [Gammaproteobacteria bacterium]|nr:glycosyltransferase [Gammaproteobacteria bacterium]
MNISVIIPSYNRAHLLVRAVQSVLNQTLPAQEVIVVDDGSSDHTATVMAEEFPHCHYIKQPNRGVSAARNTGIAAASGEWLAFLDSDDEWLPSKLAAQQQLLQQQPEIKLCHTEEIWIRNGKRVNQMKKHAKSGGHIFQNCLPLCVISPSSAIIHRNLFNEVGTFDEELPACEDYDLWLRICSRHPVAFVEQPQIKKYGGHEDQLSHHYWGMDRFRIQALEKIIQSGVLNHADRTLTLQTLTAKAEILAQGATKRDKQEEARTWLEIRDRYA